MIKHYQGICTLENGGINYESFHVHFDKFWVRSDEYCDS
jgi:hypothetical protein